jgi:hypothetical protein
MKTGRSDANSATQTEAAASVVKTALQNPVSPAHGCPAGAQHDREVPEIDVLTPARAFSRAATASWLRPADCASMPSPCHASACDGSLATTCWYTHSASSSFPAWSNRRDVSNRSRMLSTTTLPYTRRSFLQHLLCINWPGPLNCLHSESRRQPQTTSRVSERLVSTPKRPVRLWTSFQALQRHCSCPAPLCCLQKKRHRCSRGWP